jgi:hypothetical protein
MIKQYCIKSIANNKDSKLVLDIYRETIIKKIKQYFNDFKKIIII